jgi:hypothetical protein
MTTFQSTSRILLPIARNTFPAILKMAAFVKAINAKIRSNPTVSYFCSTRT